MSIIPIKSASNGLRTLSQRSHQSLHPKSISRPHRRLFSHWRTCPELSILFCGSDVFSSASLRALVHAQRTGALPIRSIDVVCRPPKRAGTGMKEMREVKIAATARKLELPVHQIDTFTGWEPPVPVPTPAPTSSSFVSDLAPAETPHPYASPWARADRTATPRVTADGTGDDWAPPAAINLVVAVSFGLLIPARILRGAQYGGLNVHPSLLPDFRGAAPIERSLLAGQMETGVTLQTLHPSRFDHGEILLQKHARLPELDAHKSTLHLAEIGADMLVEGLRSAVFLEPREGVVRLEQYRDKSPIRERHAPKIVPEDHHILWYKWSAREIIRRQKVLGPLWSYWPAGNVSDANSRVKWTQRFVWEKEIVADDHFDPGSMFYKDKQLYIVTCDRKVLRTKGCTPAGKPQRMALEAAQYLLKKKDSITLS